MEYPKINSLWKREGWNFEEEKKRDSTYQKGGKNFIEGAYSLLEFAQIKEWRVEEKIDGTNIRIFYQEGKVRFGGRTSNAQIPCELLNYLQETFTETLLDTIFPIDEKGLKPSIILFGEGYGPKIQAGGGNYRKDPGFMLFDIIIGRWWLTRESVFEIASKLGVPFPPQIGMLTEQQIVSYVKTNPQSLCSRIPQVMEGVICRTDPLLLLRNGLPLMWKLKCKDFIDDKPYVRERKFYMENHGE